MDVKTTISKISIITMSALIVLGLLYVDTLLFLAGRPVLAVVFLAIIGLGVLVYTWSRAYTYRYLFPGLAGFGLFVLLPLFYTVYIAFTNYSAANLLSYDDAKTYFHQETYLASEQRCLFHIYPTGESGSTGVQVYLANKYSPEQVYVSKPFQLDSNQDPNIVLSSVSVDKRPSSTPFTMRQIVEWRKSLHHLNLKLPDGEIVSMLNLREFAPIRPLWEERGKGFINVVTGEVIQPDKKIGFFINRDGNRVGPGFRIHVGFRNFINIFMDPGIRGPFLRIFLWNLAFAFLSVFFTFCLGVFLAVLLEWKSLRGRKIYRTFLILPYAVPAFISILIFKGLFNENFGEINLILSQVFGIRPEWTSNPTLARAMLLIVNAWLGYPYMMLICTGLLQSIPDTLYEASNIDGSGPINNFFRITLPLITRPLYPLLIASFAFNFNNFLLIFLLTGGRPDMVGSSTIAGETDILVSYTFRIAFRDSAANFGYASAIATLIFIMVAAMSYANLRTSGRRT